MKIKFKNYQILIYKIMQIAKAEEIHFWKISKKKYQKKKEVTKMN